MVVRRARHLNGSGPADVDSWFAQVRDAGGPVLLADAGVRGDSVITTPTAGWRVGTTDGGLLLSPCEPVEVELTELDDVTDVLRTAAVAARDGAGGGAPPLWSEAVNRAIAILDSSGSGEELSDVAWPHFLLPTASPLRAHRLAASAATLWLWGGPGAWTGTDAERAHAQLRDAVADALIAAVDAAS
ncbi:MAG TPA: hypothetical protein VG520_01805 [Candidatus Dormibacteraeota bacterium]|nr:hypothetical protein [Candidatus Dormibacteraeota bacterium]